MSSVLGAADVGQTLARYERHLMFLAHRNTPRILRSRLDAADVVQNTFAAASEYLATNAVDPERIGALLRTILRRCITDAMRTHCADKRSVEKEEQMPMDFLPATIAPESSLIQQEEIGALMEAMADLSPIHCEVLRLRYFDNLSESEVGVRIGRSEDAAAGLIKRAKASLRRVMVA